MENTFLKKIQSGKHCLGTFSMLGTGVAIEGLHYAGMDFIIIDTEHGPFEAEHVQDLIRAAKLHGMTPFVRVKDVSRPAILKMLDAGAHGLIIPQINTVDEVKKVVEYGKYFPEGMRGVSVGCSGGYGYEPFAAKGLQSYFDVCNEQTLLFPQCETRGCLDNIEEIAALPGVDGIFIGPYDLSVALGKPGAFDTKEFTDAVACVKRAVKEAGKILIMYTMKESDINAYFDDGFDAVTWGTDIKHLISLLREKTRNIHNG